MAQFDAVQVIEFNAATPVQAAQLVKQNLKEPGAGEVQVTMKLAGVNPSDVFSLMGVYPGFTTQLPGVPGFDGMGVVSKVGAGVTDFQVGQRVTSLGWMADQGQGSWQGSVTLPAERLVALPDNISDEAGAQFYVSVSVGREDNRGQINPVTVVGLLEVSGVKAGEHLLITAAGSTLSRMLIKAAKVEGIKTIGVVRRAEAVEEVKASTGCDEVICSTTEDLVARVKQITAEVGAAAVIDSVGGEQMAKLAAAVRDDGEVWLYGLMDGLNFTGNGPEVLFRHVSYKGFWFSKWLYAKPIVDRKAVIDKTLRLMADGVLAPEIGTKFPLSDWQAAVKESQVVGRVGKVLLRCS
eukprot:gene4253-4504_t